MNAFRILKEDHRKVKGLFLRFERAGEEAVKEKRQLAEMIIHELSVHASVEEQTLYPYARARDERLDDLVLEALEEHHVAKATLLELQKMSPEDERFDAKMTVLIESVKHHIEEEEGELFPRLERVLVRDEIEALGDMIMQLKKGAPTRPHPMAPDTPPGNMLIGPVAALLDRSRDFARSITRRSTRAAAKTVRKTRKKGGRR